jgi:multidrug resistance protein, MATE family
MERLKMENPEPNVQDDTLHKYPPGGYRQLLILAYPVVITMLSQTLMGLVDTIMVGGLGTAQLGAVGLGGIIIWTFFSFFNGLISSANTFIAQDYGAKEYSKIGENMWHYIYIAIFSYIIVLPLSPISSYLLKLIGASPEVETYGSEYMKIIIYSGIGVFINFTIAGFFRGIGNTKPPMYIGIIANIFNVIGNYVLIFGKFGFPRLEVKGAALATLLSTFLSTILYLIFALSKKYNEKYGTRVFYKPKFNFVRRIIRIGIPMGIQFFLDTASFSLFTAFIAKMGNTQLAATNAALSLMSTSFMPLIGISIAATTLVGQFIGAKEMDYARKSGYTSIKVGFIYTLIIAGNFFIIPKQLMSIISKDPEVIELGAKILMMAGLFQVSDGFGICSNGALRGAGDTRFTMIIGLIYAWFLFVPLAYILGFVFNGGVVGAWFGATIYIIIYGITVFIRFHRGKWQKIKI